MSRILIFLFVPGVLWGQHIDKDHQLLWEISGNGLQHKSFLFGSFHSNDKRVFSLTDSTYFALNAADVVALETDVFSMADRIDTRVSSVQLKYDNKGKPFVSSPDPTETFYGNEDGMPQFLDAFFQEYAYNAQKVFVPLEEVDFQLNILSNYQLPSFKNLHVESFLSSKEDMINVYLKGDIYKLDEMLRASLAMYPNGYKELIIDRNLVMSDKIDSLLHTTNRLFCAVGAGHLAGPSGLIHLLRKKGYMVRKVVASYSDELTVVQQEVRGKNFYQFTDDSLGLNIVFPGKPKRETEGDEGYTFRLTYQQFGQGNVYEVEVYPRDETETLFDAAQMFIASPAQSPFYRVELDDGREAFEGIADAYPEGVYWVRVMMSDEVFIVMKSYGGNKFMNSNRAQRFFENVWLN